MINKPVLRRMSAGGLGWLLLLGGCSPAPTKGKPQTYMVEIKQMQFQPAVLQLHKNDTVLFINRDMVAHTATEATSKSWSSPTLPSDSSWKVAIGQSADYYCTIHPVMKGKIVVQ